MPCLDKSRNQKAWLISQTSIPVYCLIFHTALLFLWANDLFFLYLPSPQQSHRNALPTLLSSISIWHSSANCMKLGLQPLLHPISGGAEGFPLLIIRHRSRVRALPLIRRVAVVGVARWGSCYASPCHSVCRHGGKGLEGRLVMRPIIFTYLLLPASGHVILNALRDPCAGFGPLENTFSKMKLSQETACAQQ